MAKFQSSIAINFLRKKKEISELEKLAREGDREATDNYQVACKRVKEEYGIELLNKSVLPQVRGILFGDGAILKYFDLQNKTTYALRENSADLYTILAADEEVYFGGRDGKVHSLFRGFTSQSRSDSDRKGYVNSLQEHNGKLLDCGWCGLASTLDSKVLISREELGKKELNWMISLATDPQGNLFTLIEYKDQKSHGFFEINYPKGRYSLGRYSLGEEILHYGIGHNQICQTRILPWGSLNGKEGKNYPFSVLSCVPLKHLEINGDKITGTEVEEDKSIHRIELLGLKEEILEVIYSGKVKHIIKAQIDLRKRKVVDKENILQGLSGCVLALEVVRDYALHQRLVELGK